MDFKGENMNKRIKMSASEVDLYRDIYRSYGRSDRNSNLSKDALKSLDNLLNEVKKIKPNIRNERWEFWFSVPRGTLDQYIKFNKYYGKDEYSKEKFKKLMDEEFPYERAWFRIEIINENGYKMVFLDNSILVNRSPDGKVDFFPDLKLDRILEFLYQVVIDMVKMLEQGTYNDYVRDGLPYENRMGVIKRSTYWKLVPNRKKADLDGLKRTEIAKFLGYINAGNGLDTKESIGRYKRMSSGKYYEVCSYCYLGAGLKGLKGKTPKEMFERYGDSRDGGMSLLNENSEDDFDKWFNLSIQEKWEIENPSHMYEIVCGHSHTMIHLILSNDENGYWFSLSDGTHCQTMEVVRMYNAMKDKGVPATLWNEKEIADKLLGNDELGIIPNTESAWEYWYGVFQKTMLLILLD